jgi:hypothetical protein
MAAAPQFRDEAHMAYCDPRLGASACRLLRCLPAIVGAVPFSLALLSAPDVAAQSQDPSRLTEPVPVKGRSNTAPEAPANLTASESWLRLEDIQDLERQRLDGITSPSRWSVDLSLQGGCPACAGITAQAPGNPNAPWTVRAAITLDTGDSQFTLGVIGQRNHRLPAYLAQSPGADADTIQAASGMASMAQTHTNWQLLARARRTLSRLAGGQTVGIVGEAFVPLSARDVSPLSGLGAQGPSSRAVRFGPVFGF